MTKLIAMWSGPRNLSTATMYAFAARGDSEVRDEPFYAAYLARTGLDHPMRDAILAAHETDPEAVARSCTTGTAPVVYQKHMVHHMVPGIPRDWFAAVTHAFLIRHPARVVASYAAKRENPTAEDLGFAAQARLWDEIADATGTAPPVVSAEAVRADPAGTLQRLCAALGIPWTERMLSWPAGPKPYDGAWAPHWYPAVHASTGFGGAEGPLPVLDDAGERLVGEALPHYERLLSRAI